MSEYPELLLLVEHEVPRQRDALANRGAKTGFARGLERGQAKRAAMSWRGINRARREFQMVSWDGILAEYLFDAMADDDPTRRREKFIRLAAGALVEVG